VGDREKVKASGMQSFRLTVDDLGFFEQVEDSVLGLSELGDIPLYSSWVANYRKPSERYLKSKCAQKAGLHFNVLEGPALLKSDELTDKQGRFHRTWASFLWPSRRLRTAVEGELIAQVEKTKGWFGHLTHVDSHLHLHSIPWINKMLRRAQARYQIEHVRAPYQPAMDHLTLNPKIYILLALNLFNERNGPPCFGISKTFQNRWDECLEIANRAPREFVWHTMTGSSEVPFDQFRFIGEQQLELRKQEHRQLEKLLQALSKAI
jgi:hypothetical protein